MLIAFNPSEPEIKHIIFASDQKAAKWIRNNSNGDTFYWAAELSIHANMACVLSIQDYEKGIATLD